MVPLFSLVSSRSWGVGEFLDLPVFARWLQDAGQSFVQVLPLLEIPEHETSPYSAVTAMALDPMYISLPALEDFEARGGTARFEDADRAALAAIQSASRIPHRAVRALKGKWLRRSYERFLRDQLRPQSARAERFQAFVEAESSWLDDYALFQSLRGAHALSPWWKWPDAIARRDPIALARASSEHGVEIGYRKYIQWVAAEQWSRARTEAAPTQVFGDVPFMISADSPDVWAEQRAFRFDATVGVPPDAFSETGQDWGLPPWRWEVMAESDFAWMRRRANRSAALFDGFRLDHLVGLYRTFMRPVDRRMRPFFAPPDEASQLALGERLVKIYQESGAEIIAEDLGTVPDFVRASIRRLGVPGYKVLRWERRWAEPSQPFIDPSEYDEISAATTGTHDTESLADWWDALPEADRARILALPSVSRHAGETGDKLVRAVLDSGSRLAILPVQDLFGWRDRINTPATIDEINWTWRLPFSADRLEDSAAPRVRAKRLADWTREAGRAQNEELRTKN